MVWNKSLKIFKQLLPYPLILTLFELWDKSLKRGSFGEQCLIVTFS